MSGSGNTIGGSTTVVSVSSSTTRSLSSPPQARTRGRFRAANAARLQRYVRMVTPVGGRGSLTGGEGEAIGHDELDLGGEHGAEALHEGGRVDAQRDEAGLGRHDD